MENDTTTYKEMYDGSMIIIPPHGEDYFDNSACYYYGDDIGFTFSVSNKLAQDKPTVEISFPAAMLGISEYTVAAADHCLRAFKPYIDELNAALYNKSRPDNENGRYYLCEAGGEVLVRNTAYFALCLQKDYWYHSGSTIVLFDDGKERPPRMCLCLRIQVQLPRRKLRRTVQMLCRDLPDAVERFIADFDTVRLERALALAEKQAEIRAWLKNSEYCAFIANGSILPRSKGTELPMENAVPFRSPKADEITVCGVLGMGIKRGVTVITGGGYSGKSTLLDAISAGIYDHAEGDGRELCITDDSAVTIAAEDGRSVKNVNISPFIKWLPGGDTEDFSTDHASGSTSQAANIMEAVDFGAKLLLIDEDRSATNFMIRDAMMKELIEKEPITPFTDRVNELWRSCGVSSILVIGGSGEYLAVADRIYMMEDFLVHDVTGRARDICKKRGIHSDLPTAAKWEQGRRFFAEGFTSYPERSGSEKLEVYDLGFIFIGDEKIDIRGLNDIKTSRQLFALGFMLRYLEISNRQNEIDLVYAVDELYAKIEREGLDTVFSAYFTTCERFLDLPRKAELLAVINRMRKVKFAK
ncbi:MAG: ATPase [Clostridia bacterium]|nr:ATPase [Clostridia bacterium]